MVNANFLGLFEVIVFWEKVFPMSIYNFFHQMRFSVTQNASCLDRVWGKRR